MAQERQFGQRFLRAARAVVCIEAAGSVRCVWGARGRWDGMGDSELKNMGGGAQLGFGF